MTNLTKVTAKRDSSTCNQRIPQRRECLTGEKMMICSLFLMTMSVSQDTPISDRRGHEVGVDTVDFRMIIDPLTMLTCTKISLKRPKMKTILRRKRMISLLKGNRRVMSVEPIIKKDRIKHKYK